MGRIKILRLLLDAAIFGASLARVAIVSKEAYIPCCMACIGLYLFQSSYNNVMEGKHGLN